MTNSDFSARLAALSHDKRALLERALAERAAAAGRADAARPQPRHRDDPVPLTDAQQLLWLAEQMRPADAAYNVPVARRVRGALDIAALERALTAVVAAHEALRTTFVEENGEPVQRVGAPWSVRVAVADLTGSANADHESAAALRVAASAPFDLATGPLLRVLVVRRADETILLVVAHHLVFDGASIDVFLRDLAGAYDAALRGDDPVVLPPPLQAVDLAQRDRAAERSATFASSTAFWREYLAGASTDVDLMPDQPAGREAGTERAVVELPPSAIAAVERTAAAFGATTFMVLLAAFEAVLHRYTSQEDFVVGVPVAGRAHADASRTIGHFTDTVLVRARLSGDMTFSSLLSTTRDDVLRVLEHQGGAAAALRGMQESGSGSLSGPRLLFGLQPARGDRATLGGLPLEPVATIGGGAKFLLSINAIQGVDRIRLTAEFSGDRYSQPFIARLLTHYARFLEVVVAHPESRVNAVEMTTPDEREQLLEQWNATAVSYPEATLVDLIRAQVARTPEGIAVEDERRPLTFAELDAASDALAATLAARGGSGPGAIVAVCAERSVELVVALVAVLKTGAAYVPVDPQYPADRVAFMLADAAPAVVITTAALAAQIPALGAGDRCLLHVDAVEARLTAGVRYEGPGPAPDDAAYMIYTSGSTGRPKGALNAHRGIVNRLLWMQDTYALTAADVVLQKTPASFDVSVWEFFWPLLTGARLVLARPGGHRDTRYLIDAITGHGVTVCHFVPSMLRAFLADPEAARCTGLRDVIASGEALAPDLVAEFHRVLPTARLHNLYGPTECAVDVTAWACPPTAVAPATVPIGRPIANTRLYVLDAARAPVPVGVPGELYIAGVQVGLGYHARPALTAERFVADPFSRAPGARMYRTGDRARWRPDGTIEYLGRLDHQVKLRGFRIELGEIEATLATHPAVDHAVVVLRELSRGGAAADPTLVAFYVPRGTPSSESMCERSDGEIQAALRAHLRAALPAHMIPSVLVPLAALPLTPSGKADRRALTTRPIDESPYTAGVAPRTAVEAAVADVWGMVLGRPVGDVEASFLDLGGHSLLATRAVGQVARVFGTTITLRSFFERPTVAGHAAALLAADAVPGRAERIADLFLQARRASAPESVPSFAPLAQSQMPAGSPT